MATTATSGAKFNSRSRAPQASKSVTSGNA